MITPRLAIIIARMLIVFVAAFYGVLKFVVPDASPILGVPAEVAVTLNAPFYTNPVYARLVILTALAITVLLLVISATSMVRDYKAFGHVAPYSSPGAIALLSLFSCMSIYYFVVSIVAGGLWYFSGTVAAIAIVMSVYEGRQYAQFNAIKTDPLDH
jgi:hypothetical protein